MHNLHDGTGSDPRRNCYPPRVSILHAVAAQPLVSDSHHVSRLAKDDQLPVRRSQQIPRQYQIYQNTQGERQTAYQDSQGKHANHSRGTRRPYQTHSQRTQASPSRLRCTNHIDRYFQTMTPFIHFTTVIVRAGLRSWTRSMRMSFHLPLLFCLLSRRKA